MFGHQDEPAQQTSNDQPAVTPSDSFSAPAPAADTSSGPIVPPANPTPVTDTNYLLEAHEGDGQTGAPEVTEPSSETMPPSHGETVITPPGPASTDAPVGGSDDLQNLKQQALQQLSPLVGQLEQSPEEKFRTTMMMIQASDNKDLLQTAYEAANQIPDEKARAQALLDVINEINYFAQQGK